MSPPTTTTWPPTAGLTSNVVPRPAILAVYSSTTIHASAAHIFQVLRDTSHYPEWNNFVPKIHIHSQPSGVAEDEKNLLHVGTSFTLDVVMDAKNPSSKTPTQCRVTDISTPNAPSTYVSHDILEQDGSYERDLSRVYRISWTTEGGFVARGLRSERVSEIIELGDGKCEFRTWECEGGLLARVVKWKFERTLNEKFALWCEDLKRQAEAGV